MLIRKLKTVLRYIRKGKWSYIAQLVARKLLRQLKPVLSPVIYESISMYIVLGYWPNLRHPRSFNEKLTHQKLFIENPLFTIVSDKWRVRQYVSERVSKDILNEVYFVGNDPENIPFDDLPSKFAIKANHGSGWNILVTDKATFDRRTAVIQCRRWMRQKYSSSIQRYERQYDEIKPLMIVEKFIEPRSDGLPLDYKFMCFHGVAHFIYVVTYALSGYKLTYYDTNWRDLDFEFVHPKGRVIPKPPQLNEMIVISERLSSEIDYCRVDLYCPNDEEIIFGEITICPGGGHLEFNPTEWDFRMGEYW